MPVNLKVARCKVATMKSRYQFCWLLILYLLELSIVSSAIDQAAERHIDDVDVHFQEYHLEDDFKPSEVLGPIDGFQQSGPIIIRGKILVGQNQRSHIGWEDLVTSIKVVPGMSYIETILQREVINC